MVGNPPNHFKDQRWNWTHKRVPVDTHRAVVVATLAITVAGGCSQISSRTKESDENQKPVICQLLPNSSSVPPTITIHGHNYRKMKKDYRDSQRRCVDVAPVVHWTKRRRELLHLPCAHSPRPTHLLDAEKLPSNQTPMGFIFLTPLSYTSHAARLFMDFSCLWLQWMNLK